VDCENALNTTDDRQRAQLIAVAAFALAFIFGLFSNGVHHDDDLTHFLMARWSWRFPEYLLNFWARPGFTLPMAAVAWIGSPPVAWHFARLLSAVVTLAATLLAIRVADRLAVRPLWLVALACVLQPMATLLSYTTLVENFASLYIIAALALLISGRLIIASLVFSAAFVTRYDTLVMLPIWWLALWGRQRGPIHRQPRTIDKLAAMAASISAPLLHMLLLKFVLDAKPWLLFASPSGSSQYTAAGLLVFIPQVLIAIPAVILALAIVGAARLLAAGRPLVPALAGIFLLTHIVLRARGLYASGGFARFLVTIAPLVGILAAAGVPAPTTSGFKPGRRRSFWYATVAVFLVGMLAIWSECRAGRITFSGPRALPAILYTGGAIAALSLIAAALPVERWRRRTAIATAVILAAAVAIQFFAIVRPLRRATMPRLVADAEHWIDSAGLADRPIFAATPWVTYDRALVEYPRIRKSQRLLASMPVGTIVIWDRIYAPSDYHRLPLESLDPRAYRKLHEFRIADGTPPDLIAFEKIAATPVPATEPPPYPPEMVPPAEPAGTYYIDPHK